MSLERKQWGLVVPRKQAESVRKRLIEQSIIDKSLKPYSSDTFVIFPIKTVNSPRAEDSFKVVQRSFLERRIKPNFKQEIATILPSELYELRPRGFDVVAGRVAIIQLNEELLPFSKLIADVLARTGFSSVYLRVSNIEGAFRLRHLRLLYGKSEERLIHRENGIDIVVSLEKAYFNPRLSTEHERVVQQAKRNERVLDMFTGVGPFALQLAKHRSATVDAWDVNDEAIACLQESIALNRIDPKKIRPVIGDAKDLALTIDRGIFDRVLMNLPGKSVEYVREALSLCRKGGIIHYYRFGISQNSGRDVIEEFCAISEECDYKISHIRTYRVRDVAPGKSHFCCEFRKE